MDIQGIQAFLAVSESRSFSRAADKLFLTQPAVSKRIQALEHTLDITLFDRVGKHVDLTAAGHALLPICRQILQQIEEGKRIISNLRSTTSGVLNLATSHHIGLHRLPPVLREFSSRYPEVELRLNFMDSEQAQQQLINGDIELAIITLPDAGDDRFEMKPVWQDPLGVVVSVHHALSGGCSSRAQLLEHAAILPSRGTYTRQSIDRALGLDSHQPTLLETHYLETIKAMVQAGLGWSMLPLSMLDDSLVVLDVRQGSATRQLGTVVHSARTRSNAANAMIRLLERYADPVVRA